MIRNLLSDERGSILPVVAMVVAVAFTLAAIALDFARYKAASEKLQTADDAAALAAAMTADRYVTLEIDMGEYTTCCGDEECDPCCRSCGTTVVSGLERDLIDNGGWEKYCCDCGGCSYTILDRWVEFRGSKAFTAAETMFELNRPAEMDAAQGGDARITGITVYDDRHSPYYPSVVVRTFGRVKTLALNFLDRFAPGNFDYLSANRCGQGGTFYYDLNGRWHRAAEDACN
ncbi:pilus assembly protein TadG-related protein [Desulfofundulus salinus]|uniref:Putative Flp pilus-assembly TadG-like N-terminal domain-containing protein n=1 Tax=Desulfofundulus salinus TaxID=2419843 RepID=A0A494WVY2_9FIRM|nr:pilus assembly protein TadG-related protein [Desulfofundulus salinum]RKO66392.1 hypothetical protein D7024_05165 [Desulfofundulus salinum]